MHHSSAPTPSDCSTTHARLAHPPSWLLACAMGLALTACGGGSGSDGGAGDPGPGGTASSGVFIAPSGPLCTKLSSTGNCLQPTSSAIEESDLIKLITDPDAQTSLIDFSGMGVIHNTTLTYSQQPGQAIESSFIYSSYGMARRDFQVGRNTFIVQGRQYPQVTHYPEAGQSHYKNISDDAGVIFLVGPPDQHEEGIWGTTFSEGQNLSKVGRMPNMRSENTNWISAIRLLTDQSQAPSEPTVTYIGSVSTLAGTAQRLDPYTTDILDTGVNYEAEFNTATGKLTGVKIDYTDPKSQRRTVMEVPELTFVNSRLIPDSRSQRINVVLEGPASDVRADAPRPDTPLTRQDYTLDSLEGEITGKQAEIIHILGAGPQGTMQLMLMRKDKAGPDVPIHIPLPHPNRP